ncbi:MAG TPA: hypothetical protein VFI42_00085, partial [Thermomicrobiaceae bacterium]|nr:hypothetical protein [Thermomicrobiaceae bacterium]
EERERDPVSRAAWRYLEHHAPLRSRRERALLFRFWLARDSYQDVSAIQSLIFGKAAQFYLTTPGLAFSFFRVADPAFWEPMFGYVDLARLPEAEVEIGGGGQRQAVFGHDWRVTPPTAWLDLLAARELDASPPAPPERAPAVVLLSQPDFAAAARDALRQLTRPEALRGNPLLRSRMVIERAGSAATPAEREAALRALLREATERLQAHPRQAKLYRALYHTYVSPAATQEQAAELMDLPFSTYRRHLAAGVAAVVDLCWEWELQGSSG